MTFTQPEQRVRTGARRVRAVIIAALGIALIVTMGPAPASAQTTVVRECGDHYVVTRYNQDGTVKGVHNKQLSPQGTIYTGGKTWKLVEGNPDRFVSDGEVLQVSPCAATLGVEVRQFQQQVPGTQQQVQSTALVSNITETAVDTTGIDFSADYAQSFRTGSNSAGYRLTSITIDMKSTAAPTYTAAIHAGTSAPNATAVANGTLTNPTLATTFTNVEFSASGNGIDLDANTTYWLVFDGDNANTTTHFTVTGSDAQTGTGWGIGNDRLAGTMGSTGLGSVGTGPNVFRFTVEGYAKVTPPALVSAEVTGTTLVLTYDKDLNTASRTAARQFGIKFGGGALQGATRISISGKQVTLTVPEVRSGQVVTVSYTVPTRNPLKGSNGEATAAFSDQAVTVKTGPAYGRLPASGNVRDAVYVTADNGEVSEVGAYSADRETLWDYFESQCTHLRSVSDPYRDYSLFNADGRRIQARNGWKWVEVQNAAGDVTHTRAMTINECASNALYQRQAFCNNYTVGQLAPSNRDNVCPADRSW